MTRRLPTRTGADETTTAQLVAAGPATTDWTRKTAAAGSTSSKSQIRTTVHPISASLALTSASRSMFRLIFRSHPGGCRPSIHRDGCPCHHAESTNTATFRDRQQRSGVPGISRRWQRQPRTPAAQRARRKASSGPVFLARTRAITRLRVWGSSGSRRPTRPVLARSAFVIIPAHAPLGIGA
jgi:hypothetical protein